MKKVYIKRCITICIMVLFVGVLLLNVSFNSRDEIIGNPDVVNNNFYVGYGIKDISPLESVYKEDGYYKYRYNTTNPSNPIIPIVSECVKGEDKYTIGTNADRITHNYSLSYDLSAPEGGEAKYPLPLSGSGHEDARALPKQCVVKDNHIKVTAVAIKDESNKYVIFINADLISFFEGEGISSVRSDFSVNAIRNSLIDYVKDNFNGLLIEKNHILLNTTHNHSGPSASYQYNDEEKDAALEEYFRFVKYQINKAVGDAINSLEKANITYDSFEIFVGENGEILPENTTAPKKYLNFIRHVKTPYEYSNGEKVILSSNHGFYGIDPECVAKGKSKEECYKYTSDLKKGLEEIRKADHEMPIIKITFGDNSNTKPILMTNWQSHPTTPSTTDILANFVGDFRNKMDKYGYRIAYFAGAGGDTVLRNFIREDSSITDTKKFKVIVENNETKYELFEGLAGQNEEDYNIEAKYYMSGTSTDIGFYNAKVIGEKLADIVYNRVGDKNKPLKNDIKYYNGINFYKEYGKDEIQSNKIKMTLRNKDEIDKNGNLVFTDTLYINAYFINFINELSLDEFLDLVNGKDFEWDKTWKYNVLPKFQFPELFDKNNDGIFDLDTLKSILNIHYQNYFTITDGKYAYTSAGFNISNKNGLCGLVGVMLDDLDTPNDERIYSRIHASYVLGIYTRTAKYDTPEFDTFTVGDIGFVTAPYEMFSSNGMDIKKNSPFKKTFVMAYTNGKGGYLPDLETFGYGSYEVDATRYQKGTAEKNADILIERLMSLYNYNESKWYETDYDSSIDNTKNTITLTKYKGDSSYIYVPSKVKINGKEYNVIINGGVYSNNTNIKYVEFQEGTKAGNSLSELFSDCINLENVIFNNFDTSNVTDMSKVFYHCDKLTDLDVSMFDTRKVTTMAGMFTRCGNLKVLDVGNFDTTNVKDFTSTFNSLNITSLDLRNFNTKNATVMSYMFYHSTKLKTVYVGEQWNTDNVTSKSSTNMFLDCNSLVGEKGTKYNSSKVDKTYAKIDGGSTNPGYLTNWYEAYGYTKDDSKNTITLTKYKGESEYIYVPSKIKINNKEYSVIINGGVFNANENIKYVEFQAGIKAGTSLKELFSDCINLEKVIFNNFDTSNVTDMSKVFYHCDKLVDLDVSMFNTSKVTTMAGMFTRCGYLKELDVSNFNTSNVKDFTSTFNSMKIVSLDLSNFDTKSATVMSYMFYNSPNLKTIYVGEQWNTDKVNSSGNMFLNCNNILGEKGTKYLETKIDKTYARVDGGNTNPGYLTYKKSVKILPIPNEVSAKTYNGKSQESGITCPSGSTTEGTQSAINVGTYTVTCKLNSQTDYKWSDNTVSDKTIAWKINKKASSLTTTENSIELTNNKGTIHYTYNGDGEITCQSNNSNVKCSVDKSNSVINITGSENSIITIKSSNSKNYEESEKKVTATYNKISEEIKVKDSSTKINNNQISISIPYNYTLKYEKLKEKLDMPSNAIIKNVKDKVIENNDEIIGTGSKIILNNTTYDIIVKGDISKDGKISSLDYVAIRRHIMNEKVISNSTIEYLAADMNNDNNIKSMDYVLLRKIIME